MKYIDLIKSSECKTLNKILKSTESSKSKTTTVDLINKTHLPKEIKELAKEYCLGSNYKDQTFRGIKTPRELSKKIIDKKLPDGFSVGMDKDGFFIYTHRARSESHIKPGGITVKEIKFIDSTG